MSETDVAAMSTRDLRELLDAWSAATHDRYQAAALDLLEVVGLLDREGVRDHVETALHVDDNGARVFGAFVNWADLAHASVGPTTASQDRLLRLAVSIAHDDIGIDLRHGLSELGGHHARAVLAAVARALGVDDDYAITETSACRHRIRAQEQARADLLGRARQVREQGWNDNLHTWPRGRVLGVALLLDDDTVLSSFGEARETVLAMWASELFSELDAVADEADDFERVETWFAGISEELSGP